jgi:hypothetical protein
VQFEGGIELLGYELPSRSKLRLGINVATYWTTSAETDEVHEIYFEVVPSGENERKKTWAGEQHEPADWMYPTSWWKPKQIVRDFYHIRARGEVEKPTPHDVYVGLQVGSRRLSPTATNQRTREDAVYLGTVVLR